MPHPSTQASGRGSGVSPTQHGGDQPGLHESLGEVEEERATSQGEVLAQTQTIAIDSYRKELGRGAGVEPCLELPGED